MATKPNSPKHQNTHPRGFSIPVLRTNEPGTATIEVGKAPPPSRYFAADGFAIKQVHGQMRMAFFQRKLDGVTPRAMLELRMSLTPFKNMATLLDLTGMTPPESHDYLIKEDCVEPEQTLAFEVSMARVTASDMSSNLDFYYVSGANAVHLHKKSEVLVEDVVAVQFPNFMLVPLFTEIGRLADMITIVEVSNG